MELKEQMLAGTLSLACHVSLQMHVSGDIAAAVYDCTVSERR